MFRFVLLAACLALSLFAPAAVSASTPAADDPATDVRFLRVAVLLVTFDDATEPAYSVAGAQNALFTGSESVSRWMSDVSFGRYALTGRVFGPFALGVAAADTCPVVTWGDLAVGAATTAGVDLAPYSNIMVIWPKRPVCAVGGRGQLGGDRTFINGYQGNHVLAHELGHNLGLMHARSIVCRAGEYVVPLSDTCTVGREYGNPYDAMGSGATSLLSASFRLRLGLLDESAATLVAEAGTYRIGAGTMPGAGPKLLRLPSGLEIEYRGQAPGYYDGAPTGDFLTAGVLVTRPAPDGGTELVAAGGGTGNGAFVLVPGQVFVDPLSGLALRVVALDGLSATVRVDPATADDAAAPSTPSVALNSIGGYMALGWSGASDDSAVVSYAVYRNGSLIASIPSDVRSYLDWDASAGTDNAYDVVALDPSGNAAAVRVGGVRVTDGTTITAATAPMMASAPRVVGRTSRSVVLAWDPGIDAVGVNGYQVNVDGEIAGWTERPYFVVRNLAPGTTHTLSVEAISFSGLQSVPRGVRASTLSLSAQLPAPLSLSVQSKTDGTAVAGWIAIVRFAPVPGATGYRIRRDGSFLATVEGTSFVDPAPVVGSPSRYEVSAIAPDGREGLVSAYRSGAAFDSGRTNTAAPTVTLRGRTATIKVAPVAGARGYAIRIDGGWARSIAGTSVRVALTPGRHRISVRVIFSDGVVGTSSGVTAVRVR